MPEAALGCELLDQPLERHVLVRIGAQGRLPHPAEESGEPRLAGEVGTES